MYILGTIRSNRAGIPDEIQEEVGKGEMAAVGNSDGITLIRWRGLSKPKSVLLLTTLHEDTNNIKYTHKGQEILIPEAFEYYNKAKCPVDVSDQMASYSSPHRRTFKWYLRFAIELILNTSLVNACVIYNQEVRKITVTQFREELADELMRQGHDDVRE